MLHRSPLLRAVMTSSFLTSAFLSPDSFAQQQCPASGGGGICPVGNTCCPSPIPVEADSDNNPSGCIPNDLGSNGVCCGLGGGGCPPKYICTAHPQSSAPICQRDPTNDPGHIDPLVMTIPRYQLCSPPKETLIQMHGLPVLNGGGEIAYYSSHGPVLSSVGLATANIQVALIIVHGQSRNADDYFCAGHRASQMQDRFKSVLVIAPKFLEMQDGNVTLSSGGQALRWGRSDSSKDVDQAGVWRYGTDAVYPPSSLNISSFDALDAIVGSLLNSTRFPGLEQVAIFGHSSGGQMVQRWALLTNVESENFNKKGKFSPSFERTPQQDATASHRHLESTNFPRLRFAVANPSSYCYLDELRYTNGTFQRPSKHIRQSCPQYNQWEYGLDPNGPTDVRYKDLAIQKAGGLAPLVQRYAEKDVVYLAGSQDRCPTAGPDGWCNSHGLETTCMDMLQGQFRLERHRVFMQSLRNFFGRKVHRSQIIPGVGHDHSMILHSKEGLAAVFD